jgi:hypothetical protein
MLKSFARAAGFLAYLFITLEMLFMVTPFALYYYSVYSPVLAGPFSLPATAWLPAFFLPHSRMSHQSLRRGIFLHFLFDQLRQFCDGWIQSIQQLQQIVPAPAGPTEPTGTLPVAGVHVLATTSSGKAGLRSVLPPAVDS